MGTELICGLIPLCLYGIGGLVVLGLLVKVFVDRVNNKEDSYYEKNIKQ